MLIVDVLELIEELQDILALLGMLCHLFFEDQFWEQLLFLRKHFIFAVFCLVERLLGGVEEGSLHRDG